MRAMLILLWRIAHMCVARGWFAIVAVCIIGLVLWGAVAMERQRCRWMADRIIERLEERGAIPVGQR